MTNCKHGKIIDFPGTTINAIEPKKVLERAIDSPENINEVIIIGTTEDGEPYYAGSHGDAQRILWMIEQLKLYLLTECNQELPH